MEENTSFEEILQNFKEILRRNTQIDSLLITKNILSLHNKVKEKRTNEKNNHAVNNSIAKEGTELSIFSLQQEAILRKIIEKIFENSIFPSIHPSLALKLFKKENNKAANEQLIQLELLHIVTQILLDSQRTEISVLLLTKHLTLIICAFLYVCFLPVKQEKEYSANDSPASIVENENKNIGETDNQNRMLLMRIIDEMPLDFVVESLSLLVSIQEAPIWLKKQCGRFLSTCLMKERGVVIVLDRIFGGKEGTPQMYQAAVKLISTIPQQVESNLLYFNIISSQLLSILRDKDTPKLSHSLKRAVALCIGKIIEKEPDIGFKYLFSEIVNPFLVFLDAKEVNSPTAQMKENETSSIREDLIIKEEEEVTKSIHLLHFVMKNNEVPVLSHSFYSLIFPVIPTLFQLFTFTSKTKSHLNTHLKEILISYLKRCENSSSVIKHLLFPQSQMKLRNQYYFSAGSSGGVVINKLIIPMERDITWETECLVKLLKESEFEETAGNLFVDLLRELTNSLESIEKHTQLLQVILVLVDTLGISILRNVVQVCSLLKILLATEDTEMISLSLGILSTLLSGALKFQSGEEIILLELESELTNLSFHENDEIKITASQLKQKIFEKDPIWLDKEGSSSQTNDHFDIREILKDLSDPLIPVRTHGLITLRRMVLSKDPTSVKNVSRILDIFNTQIQDPDSSIYIIAIEGLTALGDLYTEKVFPLILNNYINSSLPELTRLKLGEAIMKIIKRTGDAIVKYASLLMNSLFVGVKDKLTTIRMSSLSNIAELCKIMGYALFPFIRDILDCVRNILIIEKEDEVRRGGVFIYELLIKGLGSEIFQFIPEDLTTLLQQLRRVRDSDRDPISRIHAQNALVELSNIMQDSGKREFDSILVFNKEK